MEFDPAIDVILMTAHYTTESAVEAIRKGAADYLNKPVSIAALRERIGKLIDEAEAPAQQPGAGRRDAGGANSKASSAAAR